MKAIGIKKISTGLIAIAVVMLMVVTLCACGAKQITVNVVDGDDTVEVKTEAGKTVENILAAAGVALEEGDEVDPALDTKIEESGQTIVVQRMVNAVVVVDGTETAVELLGGGAVQDALARAGVVLGDGDTVDVDLDAPLEEEMIITVTRAPKPEPAKANNSSSKGSDAPAAKTIVSKNKVENCSGDGHGYYEIIWSDGSTTVEEY